MPVVTVTTTLPGAGPQEIEAQVTKIVEEAINTVRYVLLKNRLQGLSVNATIRMEWGWNRWKYTFPF